MGLDPDNPSHIWLLHHLFLKAINEDAADWVATWNSHILQIRGEAHRSPKDMFFFSMLEDGPRGVMRTREPIHDEVNDPSTYGIDWDAIQDTDLMGHFLEENPRDFVANNPFHHNMPTELSNVTVEDPNCPMTVEELQILGFAMERLGNTMSRRMEDRKQAWAVGLQCCAELYALRPEAPAI
jgi:hypothetical protein